MKKYLLFVCMAVIASLYVSGCACGDEEKEYEDKMRLALDAAARSEQKERTFFLGFTVGMTDEQVTKHLDSLVRIGKVYLQGYNKRYTYNYTASSGTIQQQITFSPRYYNGRLYRMDYCIVNEEFGHIKGDHLWMMLDFEKTKRNDGFETWDKKEPDGTTTYFKVKDNLIIMFYDSPSESVMSYEDAPTARKAEQSEKEENEKKWKESASEF